MCCLLLCRHNESHLQKSRKSKECHALSETDVCIKCQETEKKVSTKYLLDNGIDFVLSNKFCQDPLEARFGMYRGLGQVSENPNLYTFGYQENKIRLQRSLAMTLQSKGNIGRRKRANDSVQISNCPLKKEAIGCHTLACDYTKMNRSSL